MAESPVAHRAVEVVANKGHQVFLELGIPGVRLGRSHGDTKRLGRRLPPGAPSNPARNQLRKRLGPGSRASFDVPLASGNRGPRNRSVQMKLFGRSFDPRGVGKVTLGI